MYWGGFCILPVYRRKTEAFHYLSFNPDLDDLHQGCFCARCSAVIQFPNTRCRTLGVKSYRLLCAEMRLAITEVPSVALKISEFPVCFQAVGRSLSVHHGLTFFFGVTRMCVLAALNIKSRDPNVPLELL